MSMTERLSENSRQGLEGLQAAFCPEPIGTKYNNTSWFTALLDAESRKNNTYYVYNALGQLAVEYSTETPVTTGVSYLFTDMLGSIRTVTDSSGNVTECYDYLPFGRIIGSDVNNRSLVGCHLTIPEDVSGSVVSEKFTGQPRDAETGLDYFGARYFSSPLGRFTQPDPLLNSGRPANPQTWNRYAYVLNNPLRYTDPFGLWEWEASGCDPGDKKCEDEYKKNQKLFRDSLSFLKMARDYFGKGSLEYNRINDALTAYGKEGDGGIGIGFGALPNDTAAQLDGNIVTFDPAKFKSSDTSKWLAIESGHEGTHISDNRAMAGGAERLYGFSLEFRGYQTSAFVFQGLFTPPARGAGMSFGGTTALTLEYGRKRIIWNTSWGAADAATLRDRAIPNVINDRYGHPQTPLPKSWEGK